MTSKTYGVIGMTCEHCVSAVREELGALEGVTDVTVTLEVGGASAVTIVSDSPVPGEAIMAALDEAGDYRVATE